MNEEFNDYRVYLFGRSKTVSHLGYEDVYATSIQEAINQAKQKLINRVFKGCSNCVIKSSKVVTLYV